MHSGRQLVTPSRPRCCSTLQRSYRRGATAMRLLSGALVPSPRTKLAASNFSRRKGKAFYTWPQNDKRGTACFDRSRSGRRKCDDKVLLRARDLMNHHATTRVPAILAPRNETASNEGRQCPQMGDELIQLRTMIASIRPTVGNISETADRERTATLLVRLIKEPVRRHRDLAFARLVAERHSRSHGSASALGLRFPVEQAETRSSAAPGLIQLNL